MAQSLRVKRELEGGWFQYLTMPLPALLTIQSGINQLRYATLKGIMAAKKKEITKVAPPAGPAARQKIVALYAPAEIQADRDDRRIAGRGRQGTGQAASRRGARPMILVIAEQKDGKLNRASWRDDRGRAAAAAARCRSRLRWPARASASVATELAQAAWPR